MIKKLFFIFFCTMSATFASPIEPPTITVQPSDITVQEGKTATFSITASGPGLSYRWFKNTDSIASATLATYITPATILADNGAKFSCKVTNGGGSVTSIEALLTVTQTLPVITEDPKSQTVGLGKTVTFSVSAKGSGLSYQWFNNTGDITSATSSTYIIPETSMADSGVSFGCRVTNGGGSVTSKSAVLTVISPPVITANPSNQATLEGSTATFSISATGSSLTYQWQKKKVNITGANTASYTTPPATLADSGAEFQCIVSTIAGSVTSSAATLTVNMASPKITVQPTNQSAMENGAATFSITATGSSVINYQWQKNSANIPGANAKTYLTPTLTLADTGSKYRCVVSNGAGSDTSTVAVLTVKPAAPTIIANPTNKAAAEGTSAVFAVTASGSNLSYQWQKNGIAIAGATTFTYRTPALTITDNGATFKCIVTNAGGSVSSNAAVLTVTFAAPVITAQPANQTATEGASAVFTITAQGTGLSYQWQKNGANIAGANGPSYATPPVTLGDNQAKFHCTVTNPGGSVTSSDAVLSVNFALPVIIANPSNQVVTEGNSATFSVTASGSLLSYQWLVNGNVIGNATASTYTTMATTMANNGLTFQCVITNPAGKVTSSQALLTVVIAAPRITIQPSNQSAPEGATVEFSITTTGSNISYQWQKNGTAITGATAAAYTTSPVTLSDNGSKFRCVASNSAGSVTSNEAVLMVNAAAPVITAHPSSKTVEAGETAVFSITASGSNLSYLWQKNGIGIPGAATSSYTTPPVSRADSGAVYRCVVSNSAGSVTSASGTLIVLTPKFALTFGTGGNGLTSPDGTVIVDYGDSLQIHAAAFSSYRFDHWRVDSGSVTIIDSANPDTRVVCKKGNAVISALFTAAACTLTVTSSLGGRVVSPGPVVVMVGSPTLIKAVADSGNRFDHWSATKGIPFIADSSSDSTYVVILGNAEVKAFFTGDFNALTVKTMVLPDSAKIVLDTLVHPGDTVALIAPVVPRSAFIAWRVTHGSAIILDSTVAATKIVVVSRNVSILAVYGSTRVISMRERYLPSRFAVRFQSSTGVLFFDVPRREGKQTSAVRIRVFDAEGRLMETVLQEQVLPGYYHAYLFKNQRSGSGLKAGTINLCVFESEGFKKAIPLALIH